MSLRTPDPLSAFQGGFVDETNSDVHVQNTSLVPIHVSQYSQWYGNETSKAPTWLVGVHGQSLPKCSAEGQSLPTSL